MTANAYIGLMSGTSTDGLDTVLVNFSNGKPQLLAHNCTPFNASLKSGLERLRTVADDEIHQFGMIDRQLAIVCGEAVNRLLTAEMPPIAAIGWAGHTARHCPQAAFPFSLQVGDAATIAHLTGLPVVGDFRRSDIAAGGQGAPLSPLFHRAFFAVHGEERAVLNIGGIANLSLLHADGSIAGFDTGPGNCLMDEWVLHHRQDAFDRDGAWARSGTAVAPLLSRLMAHEWLALAPPKSTGREMFHRQWLEGVLKQPDLRQLKLKNADIHATLAAFTAQTVCAALMRASPNCRTLLLAGGGAHNTYLTELITAQLLGCRVMSSESSGLHPDWVEAVGIAWLAQQRIHGKRLDLKTITGGKHSVLGTIYLPE